VGKYGVRAEAHERRPIEIPGSKRRWGFSSRTDASTWTERSARVDARTAVITRPAGMRRVAKSVRTPDQVSQVADEFGVCWWTIIERGDLSTAQLDTPQATPGR
jgi:hypothetical protein